MIWPIGPLLYSFKNLLLFWSYQRSFLEHSNMYAPIGLRKTRPFNYYFSCASRDHGYNCSSAAWLINECLKHSQFPAILTIFVVRKLQISAGKQQLFRDFITFAWGRILWLPITLNGIAVRGLSTLECAGNRGYPNGVIFLI